MKKNYTRPVWLAMLGTASILCLAAVLCLSGCIIDDLSATDTPDPCYSISFDNGPLVDLLGYQSLNISGPDGLVPCGKEGTYFLDFTKYLPPGQFFNAQWVVSGDLQLTSDPILNPVTVIGTKESGSGTISLVTTASDVTADSNGEVCPGDRVLATKTITVSFAASNITLNRQVCIDPATQVGSGTLQLIDGSALPTVVPAPGIDDVVWTVMPAGSAVLSPRPDKVTCDVTNVTSDNFTVFCQLASGNCTSAKPLEFQVTVQNCP